MKSGPIRPPDTNIATSPPAAGWPSSIYVKATVPTDAGARFQIGDTRLSAKGSKTPIVMKEGLMAYEVTYPANGRDKSNMNITFAQPGYFPSTQARFRFKIFPDPAWPFSGTPSGKLAGFAIGKGASSGGHYSTNGASMRLTWDANGGLSPYVYPELHQALNTLQTKKKLTIPQLDQDPGFMADAPNGAQSEISPAGTHMWHPKHGQNSYALAFVRGRWNQIEMFVKLNTPGKYDGIVEYSVNGKTLRFEKMRYRYDSSLIESVQIHTFFGGGQSNTSPLQVKMWYADFEFYKS